MVYIYRSMKVAGLFFGAKCPTPQIVAQKLTIPKFFKLKVVFFFIFLGEKTDPFPTLFGVEFPSWSWRSLNKIVGWKFPYYYINQQFKVSPTLHLSKSNYQKNIYHFFFVVWGKFSDTLRGSSSKPDEGCPMAILLPTSWGFERECPRSFPTAPQVPPDDVPQRSLLDYLPKEIILV